LIEEKSLKEIFHQVFIPLLELLLWQTDTISPAHEMICQLSLSSKVIGKLREIANTGRSC
jgi:hypothetical protein